MSAKASTAIAVLVSTSVIVTCGVVVSLLLNDINSLYDDILVDLDEIREINSDAWDNMMQMQAKGGKGDIRNLFEFRRVKRETERAPPKCSKSEKEK